MKRWLDKVKHLEKRGHWPVDPIWYDDAMVCRRCISGGHRVQIRALSYSRSLVTSGYN